MEVSIGEAKVQIGNQQDKIFSNNFSSVDSNVEFKSRDTKKSVHFSIDREYDLKTFDVRSGDIATDTGVQYNPDAPLKNLRENVVKFLNEGNFDKKNKAKQSKACMTKSVGSQNLGTITDEFIYDSEKGVYQAGKNLIETIDFLTQFPTKENKGELLAGNISEVEGDMHKYVKGSKYYSNASKLRPNTSKLSRNTHSTPYLNRLNIAKSYATTYAPESDVLSSAQKNTQHEEPLLYEGPVGEVRSATSIPRKVITKSNRVSNIHPMYRKQWRKYKKDCRLFATTKAIPAKEFTQGLLRISSFQP